MEVVTNLFLSIATSVRV